MSGRLQPHETERRRAALVRHLRHLAPVAPNVAGADVLTTAPAPCRHEARPPAAVASRAPDFLHCVSVVTYGYALRWAYANGLANRRGPMNLRAVNAARRARGLFPFALRGEG